MTDKNQENEVSEVSVKGAIAIALSMYANEPCRICGRNINTDELKDIVFAGYSKRFTGSRAAHKRCWQGMVDTAISYEIENGNLNAIDWFGDNGIVTDSDDNQ